MSAISLFILEKARRLHTRCHSEIQTMLKKKLLNLFGDDLVFSVSSLTWLKLSKYVFVKLFYKQHIINDESAIVVDKNYKLEEGT